MINMVDHFQCNCLLVLIELLPESSSRASLLLADPSFIRSATTASKVFANSENLATKLTRQSVYSFPDIFFAFSASCSLPIRSLVLYSPGQVPHSAYST